MDEFRNWLELNNYDWNDPKLALGYIKVGQIDLEGAFGKQASFEDIYKKMLRNLNIKSINAKANIRCNYEYSLNSENWRQIQIDNLKGSYESRRLR